MPVGQLHAVNSRPFNRRCPADLGVLQQLPAVPRIEIPLAVDRIGIVERAAEPDMIRYEAADRRAQCADTGCRKCWVQQKFPGDEPLAEAGERARAKLGGNLIARFDLLFEMQDEPDYEPTLEFRLAEGRDASASDYVKAREMTRALSAETAKALKDVDAFIAPTTASPARALSEVDASMETYRHWNSTYSRNTVVANLLGLCALSVPCGFTANGMPIGLMIHAKGCDEATALRVGFAFEQATAWHQQRPDLRYVAA